MQLRVFEITEQATLKILPDQQLSASWTQDPIHRWIDIENPTTEELCELLAPLNLHESILTPCLSGHRRVRFLSRRRALYLEIATHLGWDQREKPYLSILCLRTTVITIHREVEQTMGDIIRGIELETPLVSPTAFAAIYYLLIEISKRNIDAALDVRTQAEELDQEFCDRADDIDPRLIGDLRRRISHCAAVHANNAYCSSALLTVETEVFRGSQQPQCIREGVRLSELARHIIEGARARVEAVQTEYELALQHHVENRLRFLTIISAIFLPLTLISAIYGMNFNDLPAMHQPYGYLVVIGLMAGTVLATASYFYKQGWFD